MDFTRANTRGRVCPLYKMTFVYAVLTYYTSGTGSVPLYGQGVIIRWALDFILQEVDREATTLAKPNSSFHSPKDLSWDSLGALSLRTQHDVAMKQGPIIWSVLTTIAVSKGRRKSIQKEEEGDKRDPWQVSQPFHSGTCSQS